MAIKKVGGVGIISTPLIAFNTIVDEDLSLIAHIIKNVRNPKVFDLDKVSKYTYYELISELYLRNYKNPLYFLMKDEKDKDFLDQCYKEFFQTRDFLDEFCIGTDVYDLVASFKNSGDIDPSIVYTHPKQLAKIKEESMLSSLKVVNMKDITAPQAYSQFYFRYIDDAEYIVKKNLTRRTFYFSSSGQNLNNSKDDTIDHEYIISLAKLRNQINIFDMYNENVVERAIN